MKSLRAFCWFDRWDITMAAFSNRSIPSCRTSNLCQEQDWRWMCSMTESLWFVVEVPLANSWSPRGTSTTNHKIPPMSTFTFSPSLICVLSEVPPTQALTAISCMQPGFLCTKWVNFFCRFLVVLFVVWQISGLMCVSARGGGSVKREWIYGAFLERGSPRLFLCGSSLGHTSTRICKNVFLCVYRRLRIKISSTILSLQAGGTLYPDNFNSRSEVPCSTYQEKLTLHPVLPYVQGLY